MAMHILLLSTTVAVVSLFTNRSKIALSQSSVCCTQPTTFPSISSTGRRNEEQGYQEIQLNRTMVVSSSSSSSHGVREIDAVKKHLELAKKWEMIAAKMLRAARQDVGEAVKIF